MKYNILNGLKPIGLAPHETHPNMWYVIYSDGKTGENFYNLSRAKDILRNYQEYVDAMKMEDRPNRRMKTRRSSLTGKFISGVPTPYTLQQENTS
jgi:hypothetical protein